MPSRKQIAANRLNSKKSTGPRTAPGKESVSWNSTKHGLTATTRVVLSDEHEQFDALAKAMYAQWSPQGAMEKFAFERLLHAMW